ncbi:MAG: hypothetical protein J4F35_16035 [Candidatus Latescibacteria bacterium]|nr:hypothetical protein [Candidatus Latescibacterota bacterium]
MERRVAWLWLAIMCHAVGVSGQEIDVHLSKIDAGVAWVSSYWGYNAPKLVYDGEMWGSEQATAQGALYQLRDGQWHRGYEWDGLNYQPGMVLLDEQRRLLLIYPKINEKPVILRATAPGQIDQFEQLEVPDAIGKAGYMGAGIYDERLVIGLYFQDGHARFAHRHLGRPLHPRADAKNRGAVDNLALPGHSAR